MVIIIKIYLNFLYQLESLLSGVIESDLVRTSSDEEVSISSMSATEYFLVVLSNLFFIAWKISGVGEHSSSLCSSQSSKHLSMRDGLENGRLG